MTNDADRFRTSLTAEQAAILRANGVPAPAPHRSTVLRRQAKQGRSFPVISRSGRAYRQSDGRLYGELNSSDQRQADARYWRVGIAVRQALEPMTVAVKGKVERIYEVRDWYLEPGQTKWTADLGRSLTDDELDLRYPNYPYRIGDDCPTRRGSAYRPEVY